MTPESFAYWLQGAIELGNLTTFDERQVQIVQDHLNLVFKKETPNRFEITQSPVTTLPYFPPKLGDSTLITAITC